MHQFARWVAHAWVIYMITIAPFRGRKQYRSFAEKANNDPNIKTQYYLQSLRGGLNALIFLGLLFDSVPNPLEAIGLSVKPEDRWATVITAMLVLILGIAITRPEARARMGNPKSREKALKGFEELNVLALLPTTRRQEWLWYAAALSNGTWEELVYRGFLIFYFTHIFPGVSFFAALCASSLIFGLAHLYQGIRGTISTTIFGALMGFLYWNTGNLILPITCHVANDLYFGFYSPAGNDVISEATS